MNIHRFQYEFSRFSSQRFLKKFYLPCDGVMFVVDHDAWKIIDDSAGEDGDEGDS